MPVIAILTLIIDRTPGPLRGTYIIPAVWIAWAGGAAFVASLAYLVFFYGVTLGTAIAPAADRVARTAIDIGLFAAFALHHSLFARASAKRFVARVVPARFERSVYVWIASLMTTAMCALWQPIGGVIYEVRGWARLPFWIAQLAGVALVISAARAISALELAGIHQAAGIRAPRRLTAVGPFRRVRHPIYLGWVLVVGATTVMTADRLLFAAISSLYLILAIPWEERSLAADHGDQYRAYQRSVRWRLVPGIW
jgi:protein-S-isoprenylcysteine O-methyltransferase Ste14